MCQVLTTHERYSNSVNKTGNFPVTKRVKLFSILSCFKDDSTDRSPLLTRQNLYSRISKGSFLLHSRYTAPLSTQHDCCAGFIYDSRSTVAVVGKASVFYVLHSCSCNHNFHIPVIRTENTHTRMQTHTQGG